MTDFLNTSELIGKKVLIRGKASGVQYGTLEQYLITGETAAVHLSKAIRVWYWSGAASLSQLAVTGPKNKEQSKFSLDVPNIVVTDAIEIIPCTEEAITTIESVKPWKI